MSFISKEYELQPGEEVLVMETETVKSSEPFVPVEPLYKSKAELEKLDHDPMNVLLFGGNNYYPEGGASDFLMRGSIDECKEYFEKNIIKIVGANSWGQIVDPESMQILEEGYFKHNAGAWDKYK